METNLLHQNSPTTIAKSPSLGRRTNEPEDKRKIGVQATHAKSVPIIQPDTALKQPSKPKARLQRQPKKNPMSRIAETNGQELAVRNNNLERKSFNPRHETRSVIDGDKAQEKWDKLGANYQKKGLKIKKMKEVGIRKGRLLKLGFDLWVLGFGRERGGRWS